MFQKLFNFLDNFDADRDNVMDLVEQGRILQTEHLHGLLGRCPICQCDFTGHRYARFAFTVFEVDRAERVSAFVNAAQDHNWEELSAFKEFEGNRDAIIAIALRCAGRRMALIMERDPYEPCGNNSIISCEVLESGPGQQLAMSITEDQWRSLDPQTTI